MRTKENKKKLTVAIAVLLICLLMIGGTIAWLTSQSKLENVFTVGKINPIDPDKPGPDGVDVPDPTEPDISDVDKAKIDGNLFEPNWNVNDAKLMPGSSVAKDPYVGLGAESEESYVFVSAKNSMANPDGNIYFVVDTTKWIPIENCVVAANVEGLASNQTAYISGLFRYYTTMTGDTSNGKNNVWTDEPLFDSIRVKESAVQGDFVDTVDNEKTGSVTVQAFVHQAKDSAEIQNDLLSTATEAAKTAIWNN